MFKKNIFFSILILVFILCTAFNDKKPKILIVGDSISIGYTPFVKKHFLNNAVVLHNIGNAQHTGTGLLKIEEWLGDAHWDIIQFNWGLWDLCYRHPDSKEYGNRDKINGKPEYSITEYASNLESLVSMIKHNITVNDIYLESVDIHNIYGKGLKDVHYSPEGYKKLSELIIKFLETDIKL